MTFQFYCARDSTESSPPIAITVLLYTKTLELKAFKSWSWEILCLLVYLVLTTDQLFVRPIIGLADNGDFPKVLAPRNVCDPDKEKDAFAYVYPRYVIRFNCHWDSRLSSSESVFVILLKLFAKWSGKGSFAITGVGKAHLVLVLAALIILLWSLHDTRPAFRFGLPPLVILIFSDVAYVSYLNSFYMDAASLVFLLPTVALAAAWILRPRLWLAAAFGVSGALFGLSKTQHAITGFFLACLAAWFAVRAFRQTGEGRRSGYCWAVSAVAVAAATAGIIALTPDDYKAEPLYSLVFARILPDLPQRVQVETLSELGLPEAYVEYSGTHAYSKDAPVMQQEWRDEFIQQFSYTSLGRFYIRNPDVLFHLLGRVLKDEVHDIRPGNMGNYERQDGFPPNTLAHRFDGWSSLRSRLLDTFPAHLVAFYALMAMGSLLCLFRANWSARWPLYPLVLVLTASGVVEFLFPILLDGTETSRHLFLFHVITELLIFCGYAAVLSLLPSRPRAVPRTV